MIIIHAVQKLLNISRIKPALFVSEPTEGQHLHSWYARIISTGFPGKLLVNMNAIAPNIEYNCRDNDSYEMIDIERIEDHYMDWLKQDASEPGGYRRTRVFWRKKGLVD